MDCLHTKLIGMRCLSYFWNNIVFFENVAGMEPKINVENCVQEYSAVSTADWPLLETLSDQNGKRSHRAVTEAERIPVDEGSSFFRYMNQIYQGVLNYISFEVDTTRFCDDTKTGCVGYKTVAKVELWSNTLIPHLNGIVANCPGHYAESPELNYSIFVKDDCFYSMQGPFLLSIMSVSQIVLTKFKKAKRRGVSATSC